MKEVQSLNMKLAGLTRYFQAHPIAVITDQPIKQVISKPDASGRLQKWSVLLGEYNISYRPRTAVKGQILADFLIEKPETDIVLPRVKSNSQNHGSYSRMVRHAWTGRAQALSSPTRKEWNSLTHCVLNSQPRTTRRNTNHKQRL
ncbi:hypothetical protein Tco_0593246 [Tanacetum coccineum]